MKTPRTIIAIGLAAASALVPLSCGAVKGPSEGPPAAQTTVESTVATGFSTVDGPAPGPETPYEGDLVAYARWTDASGDNLLILSRSLVSAATPGPAAQQVGSAPTPGTAPQAAPAAPQAQSGQAAVAGAAMTGAEAPATVRTQRLQLRHYRGGESVPFRDLAAGAEACPAGGAASFYRDGVWVDDFDGDGYGEAMVAYWVDCAPGAGPYRLELLVLGETGTIAIHGSTRLDPATGPRVAPVTRPDDGLAGAPEAVRTEALALWNEAQFDLARPAAWPGFFEHMSFDGAVFRGDDPLWSLTLLPQYMLLSMPGSDAPATLAYASIVRADGGLVIEGSGEVEAWTHGFRVTLRRQATIAPGGEEYPFAATVDWSDGTRLAGWGSTVAPPSILAAP